MLNLIIKDQNKKVIIDNYFVYGNTIWSNINNEYNIELGKYSDKEKAIKVFNMMINAEEQQNSFDDEMCFGGNAYPCKHFYIFRMPDDGEVK